MIVTLDSGVYISAIEYGGVPEEVLAYAVAHNELLICDRSEDEVVRVMHDKFHRDPDEVRRLPMDFSVNATRIIVSGNLSGICRDPNDDFILECDATGDADVILAGDKDLLSLGSHGPIRIVTPRHYLDGTHN